MKELGAKGGRKKETALRKEVRVDDELREAARAVLKRAMDGEAVDAAQLQAAKSLFSYRSDAPTPRESAHHAASAPKIITLVDLIRTAVECGMVVSDCGCSAAILVDGHPVWRVDPRAPRSQRPEDQLAATAARPELPEPEFVGDEAPAFDESPEAKLTRRYGAERDVVSWPQP